MIHVFLSKSFYHQSTIHFLVFFARRRTHFFFKHQSSLFLSLCFCCCTLRLIGFISIAYTIANTASFSQLKSTLHLRHCGKEKDAGSLLFSGILSTGTGTKILPGSSFLGVLTVFETSLWLVLCWELHATNVTIATLLGLRLPLSSVTTSRKERNSLKYRVLFLLVVQCGDTCNNSLTTW